MHIVMVTGLGENQIGGPNSFIHYTVPEIEARGHTVTLLRVPMHLPIPLRWFATAVQIVSLRGQMDVLLSMGSPWDSGIACLLARLFLPCAWITRVNGDAAWERARNAGWIEDNLLEFQSTRYSWVIESFRLIQRMMTRRADGILVPSFFMQKIVEGWGIPSSRIHLVYPGIPISSSRPALRGARRAHDLSIVYLGRFISLKGVRQLAKIICGLPSDISLTMVGEGPEEEYLRGHSRIRIRSKVSAGEVRVHLQAADLCVIPSDSEAFPHLALEAMEAGTPVIATNVGGTSELIQSGRNGCLISPRETNALREAILQLLSDSELRKRMAGEARKRAEDFAVQKAVTELLFLCRDVKKRASIPNVVRKTFVWYGRLLAYILYFSGILMLVWKILRAIDRREKWVILVYHRVLADPASDFIVRGMGGMCTTPRQLENHIRFLKKHYEIVSLPDYRFGTNRAQPVLSLTFDDGYREHFTDVFPLLRKYDLPATFFPAIQPMTEGKLLWKHERYRKTAGSYNSHGPVTLIYGTVENLEHAAQHGISIGCHTWSHPYLVTLDSRAISREVVDAQEYLEAHIGRPITLFAQPFGTRRDQSPFIQAALEKQGFSLGCTMMEGVNVSETPSYRLKRIGIGNQSVPILAAKLFWFERMVIFRKGRA